MNKTMKRRVRQDVPSWIRDHVTADKAIIALHLMGLSKDAGTVGVGPNRDDAPQFAMLVEKFWQNNQGGSKDFVMSCRYRVQKYHRQLFNSDLWPQITDPGINRAQFAADLKGQIARSRADRDLYLHIKQEQESQYGGW